MKAKHATFFVALFLYFIFFAFYGKGQAVTLQQALDIALNNNLQILTEKERLEEAKKGMQEASAGYLPTLNLKGNYTHLGEVPAISTPFGEFPMGEQDTTSFTLSLTQPVYTSGRLSLANRQAELNYQRTKQNLQRTQNEVIFQVKQSFYSVILAEGNVEITEKALHQARAHLEVVESFYRSGRASRLDLLRAKVEVANIRSDLIKTKNNLNLARERLASLLSVPSSSLKLEGELEFEPLGLTLDEAIGKAFSTRSDLKALKLQKDMAKISLHLAKVKNMPSLSLVGNYEYSSNADSWEGSWNANLVLSFPLFDAKSEAIVEQRKSQMEQVDLAIKQLKDAIRLQVKEALWEMQAARESLSAQEKNIQQAKEVLSIAEARYKSGTITQLELLDAQVALTRARLGYTKALYDYNSAKAALIKAVGGNIE